MPTLTSRPPRYCFHKTSGRAYVIFDGKKHWLGEYGTPESRFKYDQIVATWRGSGLAVTESGDDPFFSEILLAYWEFLEAKYGTENRRSVACNHMPLIRELRLQYGWLRVSQFGPLKVIEFRDSLIGRNARSYINTQVSRIKRMFRWAVSRQLIPPAALQAIDAVEGLQKGYTQAREGRSVESVPDAVVNATITELSDTLADMVRLQRLTGMRSGELIVIRPGDVRDNAYTPRAHKTQHYGKTRRVHFGDRSMDVLRRYLLRAAEAYCFTTRNGTPYTNDSYRRSITRAIDRFNKTIGPKLPYWHPHQLRHSRLQEVRTEYGLEAAQAVAGHARTDMTEHYAQVSDDRARAAAV